MKIKSFNELGGIYESIASTGEKLESINNSPGSTILLTDASDYVPVKTGSAMGGGPGVKKDQVQPAKKTGPEGLKGNNFEKVTKKEDPGSDEKVMAKAENNEEPASENEDEADSAKVTTPKEKVKVMETAREDNKYNYKPKFTMSKPKFDQLYEEAIKRVPFTENEDPMGGPDAGAPEGVTPADDLAADAPDTDVPGEDAVEEVTLTIPKDVAQKLCDLIQAAIGGEEGEEELVGGDDGELDGMVGDEPPAGEVAAEAVVEEPTPKEEKGNNASLQGKSNKVGDLKVGGKAEKAGTSVKSDPTPKEEKGSNATLQGKNNKVGSLTPGKRLVD